MCERNAPSQTALARPAQAGGFSTEKSKLTQTHADRPGSRRRRLWELASHTHCPLIGVCIPMPVLRRLIGKALGNRIIASDYEFHAAAVAECSSRRPISEILQRELDRRYAPAIKRFAHAKTTDELAERWCAALKETDIAGSLWAVLSHARCDDHLREQVCHDIHMVQHQIGTCTRADLQRLEQIQQENALLSTELSQLKERHARMLNDRNEEVGNLSGMLMRARGQLIARDSAIAALQDELHALRATVPALPQRLELIRKLEAQQARTQQLVQERGHWQQRAEQEKMRADELLRKNPANDGTQQSIRCTEKDETASEAGPVLQDKAVLCVGGRVASVPVYRQLIERTGGTFIHHDGEEHNASQLESSLAAADLVICQTGCISHHAYWRVKDYCKRTGKQCVFVEKPSTTSFVRSLSELAKARHD